MSPEHYKVMRRYAQKLVRGSALEADDVAQEAALHAVQGWESFSGSSRLSWLLSITHNTAGMMFRARNQKKRAGRTQQLDEWHAVGDMRADLCRLEHHELLSKAKLTKRQTDVLYRRFHLDETKVEAAGALGLNKVSVWKIEKRTLAQLRSIFEKSK